MNSKKIPGLNSLASLTTVLFFSSSLLAQGNSGNSNGQPFQELQNQIDELSSRLDLLENGGDMEFFVDCDNGESVADTILSVPRSTAIDITVSGMCNETIPGGLGDPRAPIRISGNTPSDGFLVPAGQIFLIIGGNRVFLNSLTIQKTDPGFAIGCFHEGSFLNAVDVSISTSLGATGVLVGDAGQCRITDSEITASNDGILLLRGGQLDLERSSIHGANTGINALHGSHAAIADSLIENNNNGISLGNGAHARIVNSSVSNNLISGINVSSGSNLSINNASVNGNGTGISVSLGSVVSTASSFEVKNNSFNGIQIDSNSSAALFGSGEISGNGEIGITCSTDIGLLNSQHIIQNNGIADIDCAAYTP